MTYISEATLSVAKQNQSLIKALVAGIKSYNYKNSYYAAEKVDIYPSTNILAGKTDFYFSPGYDRKVDFNSIIVKSYNGFPYIMAKVELIPRKSALVFSTEWEYHTRGEGKEGLEEYFKWMIRECNSGNTSSWLKNKRDELGLTNVSEDDVKGTKAYRELCELYDLIVSTNLSTYLHPKAIRAVKDRDYIPLAWFVDDPGQGLCVNVPTSNIYDYPLNSNKYRTLVSAVASVEYSYRSAQNTRKNANLRELGLGCVEYTPFHRWCIPNITPLGNDIDKTRVENFLKYHKDL